MKSFKIDATFSTPKIWFDDSTNNFYLTGISHPENSKEFFAPVIDWFQSLSLLNEIDITIIFDLKYINSSSFRYMKDILTMVADLQKNNPISVIWNYDSQDTDMLEDAMLLSELSGAKINYNAIDTGSKKDVSLLLMKVIKGKKNKT